MITLLVVGCSSIYVTSCAAVFARLKREPARLRTLKSWHQEMCGEDYHSIHTCAKHALHTAGFRDDCDDCWTVSTRRCIYRRCAAAAREESVREAWRCYVFPLLGSLFWPCMVPLLLGLRLGRPARRSGVETLPDPRDVAALEEDVERRIAELEKELGIREGRAE